MGHSICTVCRGKVSQCPTCREQYAGTRNLLAEKLSCELERQLKIKAVTGSKIADLKSQKPSASSSPSMQPQSKQVSSRAAALKTVQDVDEFRYKA